MWVTSTKDKLVGVMEKPLEDLVAGEIFSINSKSQKFVLSNIDIAGKICANELLADNKIGDPRTFPYADYKNKFVTAWGEVATQPENTQASLQEFDRVKLINLGVEGTILTLNESKYPDLDIIVLWDRVIHGKWITEVHPNEIESLGIKASGDQLILAQETKPMIKERQQEQRQEKENKAKELVQQELTKQVSAREEFGKILEHKHKKDAYDMATKVVNANAPDFKRIVEAGILTITAGENNYEIDMISRIVNGYLDYVHNKVTATTTNYELHVPATLEVMKIIAGTILDNYLLTREGYIRQEDGKWKTYSKRGNYLNTYSTKKRALTQLKSMEWRKGQAIQEGNDA